MEKSRNAPRKLQSDFLSTFSLLFSFFPRKRNKISIYDSVFSSNNIISKGMFQSMNKR
jgi:hypothetical protein